MVKVAINGFGRIGRNTLRAAIKEGIFEDIKSIGNSEIRVFAKLPKFSIPTPFKDYEPDFAYLLKDKNGKIAHETSYKHFFLFST